jgi:hypothetical protein
MEGQSLDTSSYKFPQGVHITKPRLGKCNSNKSCTEGELLSRLTVAIWNAQSVKEKNGTIVDYAHESDLDLYLIVESWLDPKDRQTIGKLKAQCYDLKQTPRIGRRGGGICALIKRH